MTPRAPWVDVVIVAVVAAILAVPFVVVRFPIGQDLPAHVETAAQIAALWRGDVDVSARFVLHEAPWPNSLPTVLLALLLQVMDGLTAGKLLMALGVIAWPASLALLAARLDRAPLVALIALPTAYDLSFGYGFLHFVVGKPLWIFTLVAGLSAARHPRAATLLSLVVVEAVLFHTHLLLWLSSLPLLTLVILLMGRDVVARALAAAAVVVGALPGLLWLSAQPARSGQPEARLLGDALADLWLHLGDLAPGHGEVVGWVVAAVVAVVAVVLSRRELRFPAGALLLTLLGGSTFVFSLVGPIKTPEASVVAERFSAPGVALLLLLIPVAALERRRRLALIAGGVAVAVSLALPMTLRWRAFNATEMGDFDAVVAAVPEGAAVATLFEQSVSPWSNWNARWHWPKLVALRGATTDDSFAWRDTCVVGLAPGQGPVRPPRRAGQPVTAPSLAGFDHLLLQGHSRLVDAALRRGALELVGETGMWRLFRVRAR